MCTFVSSAAFVSVVLSASYAEQRRLCSPASGRSVVESSARARSTKSGESTFVAAERVPSQWSARLCSAQHTLFATRGSSFSPIISTPSLSGGSPGCSVRTICCQCACEMLWMWCSQMRPIVHAAVSFTGTLGSRISLIITSIACCMYGTRIVSDGPSRIEPNESVAASRRRQSADVMCFSMYGITCGTTSSCTVCATRARHVDAAIDMSHASSSSSSSSVFLHRPSSSSGTRNGTAPRTKFCDVRSGAVPCSLASSSSSCRSSSSSQIVDQNSTACCPTSSSDSSCVAFVIACSVS